MSKHTPTPWRTMTMYWPKGYTTKDILGPGDPATVVAQHAQEENAAHIVHCVNLYDELVEALEAAKEDLEAWRAMYPELWDKGDIETLEKATTVLAKTKEIPCKHEKATFEDVPNGGPVGFYCPDCGREVYK